MKLTLQGGNVSAFVERAFLYTPNKVVPQVAFQALVLGRWIRETGAFLFVVFYRRDQHEPFDHALWIYGNMAKWNIVSCKTNIELKKGSR